MTHEIIMRAICRVFYECLWRRNRYSLWSQWIRSREVQYQSSRDIVPRSFGVKFRSRSKQIMTHYFQLNSIGWNGSNKMSVCPGIVELTQRFNRISFWVISVILQKQTNKIRSEVVQQFIKIAKRLHDLRKMLKISRFQVKIRPF